MRKCLLSVDWDYFIDTPKIECGSYVENSRNIVDLWYKRYILSKAHGKDIRNNYRLSPEISSFWSKIKKNFSFENIIKAVISDSHALSYHIAKETGCNSVYLFDAHADLGYGGISSLNFEVNCANWLGKLLKEGQINEAVIVYSPYTNEKPEDFNQINNNFNVRYMDFVGLETEISVSALHICRSGAWTPPWLDDEFVRFADSLGIPYEIMDCPTRKWDTENISFADQVSYMLA